MGLNNFIVTNLQVLLMGAAVLAGLIVTLSGITRYDGDDGERSTGYSWQRGRKGAYTLGIGLLLAATIAYVPAGNRGVVMDAGSGVNQTEKSEGVSLVLPFWQRVHNVNVRTQVFEYESFVQTQDLQEVTLPIALNYHVDPTAAAQLFQEVGHDYVITIIAPASFQASTEAAGAINAEDIAISRAQLASDIGDILTVRLGVHGIIVESVSVKDAVFDKDFIASVKAKVIADQKAEESLRLIDVSANEADQLRKEAAGIADALAIEAAAESAQQSLLGMTANEYVWFRTWNGVLPTTLLGDTGEFIVDLP